MSATLQLCLLGLCLTDAAFAGYRDAAGRDARIFKEAFYRRAVRRGLRHGVYLALLAAALVLAVSFTAPSPATRYGELLDCARWMVLPLGAYATVVLVALGVWAIAEADLRTLASVVVLGPLTLARPFVIGVAGALGAWKAASVPAALTVLGACLLQLALGPWLGRAWRRAAEV